MAYLGFQCVLIIAVLFGVFFTLRFYFLGLVVVCNMYLPEGLHRNVARKLQIQKIHSLIKMKSGKKRKQHENICWVFTIYLFVACLDFCEDCVSKSASLTEEKGRGVWRRLEGRVRRERMRER